jgi:crossover junction endodeoxyribonuclease RuvC
MTVILAIDPGSQFTGWAALSCVPLSYIDSGVISLPKLDFYDRLLVLKDRLIEISDRVSPNILVVEKSFVGINKDASLKIAQIRGAILALLGSSSRSLAEYTPREAKQLITGYGAASKEQVAIMIEKLLKRKFDDRLDETDALALALCHYFCHKRHFLLKQS